MLTHYRPEYSTRLLPPAIVALYVFDRGKIIILFRLYPYRTIRHVCTVREDDAGQPHIPI